MEESKEPRPEGSEEASQPSEMEEAESEAGQELLSSSENPGSEGRPEETGSGLDRGRNLLPGVLAGAVVAFAAVGIFVLGMFTHAVAFDDDGGKTVQVVGGQGAAATPTPTPGPVEVSVDDDPALGSADAPVTIIEFGDYQCPGCGQFNSQMLPQILSTYGDRVRFVFRDFPLVNIHQYALKAAEAADCANEQGAYWEYHDLLYQNQNALDDASLKNYAASLGLDTATFNQCLDSNKYLSEVQKDYQDALAAGAPGTPSFVVGVSAGQSVNGSILFGQSSATLQDKIEAALKEAGG